MADSRTLEHARRSGCALLVLAPIAAWASEAQAIRCLSGELLTQAPDSPRRPRWLAGRILLSHLLGKGPLPPLPLSLSGKPQPARYADSAMPEMPAFSISHSGGHVAVLIGPDARPVGCDIEQICPRKGLMSIARHYFSTAEIKWLDGLGGSQAQAAAFWQLWTLREAILKQQGRSVWEMAAIELQPQPPYSGEYVLQHWRRHDFSLACCLASPVEVIIEPPD